MRVLLGSDVMRFDPPSSVLLWRGDPSGGVPFSSGAASGGSTSGTSLGCGATGGDSSSRMSPTG
jgi:hypothetical protein